MNLQDTLKNNSSDFIALFKTHHLGKLNAFGSALNNKFDEESSDMDLMIAIGQKDPITHGEFLMSVWDKLEIFFKRKVDLLTYSSIKNSIIKKCIDANKKLIYDGKNEEILI